MADDRKTVVIIGATSGLGREAVRQLSTHDVNIIFVGRDASRGANVLRESAQTRRARGEVFFFAADVSRRDELEALAVRISSVTDRVDVLINNAGVMEPKRRLTVDGFEMNFAVHHIAPFLLTLKLWPLLSRSVSIPRVVNTNSEGHRAQLLGGGSVVLDFSDLQMARAYDPFAAYSRSKLANLLFTYELDRRFGHMLRANALHPGVVKTRLGRHFNPVVHAAAVAFGVSASEGARPVVALAVDPKFEAYQGTYFDRFTPTRSSAASYDIGAAVLLWSETERLLGVTFDFNAATSATSGTTH